MNNTILLKALRQCAAVIRGEIQGLSDEEISDSFRQHVRALKQADAAIAKAERSLSLAKELADPTNKAINRYRGAAHD